MIEIVRTVPELRARLAGASGNGERPRIGLVPTMGALHDGHLSIVRRARAECDVVVVSLFVNPLQFNEARDLDAYPRTEAQDAAMLAGAGCDVLFAPDAATVYPPGFATVIDVGPVAQPLEGEARGPVHFRGVATVVTKLLNMVQPHRAYFGQKDAQQTLVIRRLVADLDIPVEVVICPTVRESDGLAMSSRNQRLTAEARVQATALFGALEAIRHAFENGEREGAALEAAGRAVLTTRGIAPRDVDYLAVADLDSLARVRRVDSPVLAALAVHVGGVRLIDNVILVP